MVAAVVAILVMVVVVVVVVVIIGGAFDGDQSIRIMIGTSDGETERLWCVLWREDPLLMVCHEGRKIVGCDFLSNGLNDLFAEHFFDVSDTLLIISKCCDGDLSQESE